MTIETSANFISELNENYPKREDLIKEGDDHLRLIKSVLKNSFPNVDSQVTTSSTYLNRIGAAITPTSTGNTVINGNMSFTAGKSINFNTVSPVGLGTPVTSTSPITLGYFKTELMKLIYPVGSIYITTAGANPSTLLGIGTWEAYAAGRVLMGYGTGTDSNGNSSTISTGETGGYYQVAISKTKMPAHSHEISFTKTSTSNGGHRHYFCMDDNVGSAPLSTYGIEKVSSFHTGGSDGSGDLWLYRTSTTGDHTHSITVDTNTSTEGGGEAHYNVQPYIGVKMWRRIA